MHPRPHNPHADGRAFRAGVQPLVEQLQAVVDPGECSHAYNCDGVLDGKRWLIDANLDDSAPDDLGQPLAGHGDLRAGEPCDRDTPSVIAWDYDVADDCAALTPSEHHASAVFFDNLLVNDIPWDRSGELCPPWSP